MRRNGRELARKDGEVKEVITGVGNSQISGDCMTDGVGAGAGAGAGRVLKRRFSSGYCLVSSSLPCWSTTVHRLTGFWFPEPPTCRQSRLEIGLPYSSKIDNAGARLALFTPGCVAQQKRQSMSDRKLELVGRAVKDAQQLSTLDFYKVSSRDSSVGRAID